VDYDSLWKVRGNWECFDWHRRLFWWTVSLFPFGTEHITIFSVAANKTYEMTSKTKCIDHTIFFPFISLFWCGTNSCTYLLTAISLSPGGSTHLHTNNNQNDTYTKRTTQIKTNVGLCGPCPVFASFPSQLPYNWGKSKENPHSESKFFEQTYI
jgi:hypothetical protein